MKTYTIKELADIFNVNHQVIRRRISKYKLKAVNEDTREFKNTPLKYDLESYKTLENDLNKPKGTYHSDKQADNSQQAHDTSTNKLIEVLERELKHSKEQNNKLLLLLNQEQQSRQAISSELESLKLEYLDVNNQVITPPEDNEVQESKSKQSLLSKFKNILIR